MKTKLTLLAVLIPLLALFIFVALRSGPLAPVAVVTTKVASGLLHPQVSGIGVAEARQMHKIGSTLTARIEKVLVDVGDTVTKGKALVLLDPVDIESKISAQLANLDKAQLAVKDAQLRVNFARIQVKRYTELLAAKATQEEQLAIKQQELQLAESAYRISSSDIQKIKADVDALQQMKKQLTIVSPIDGIVALRQAEVGNTAQAGQILLEVFNPDQLWVNARFDQINAKGLTVGLHVQIKPRSSSDTLAGKLVRLEPKADVITEELLAKISIEQSKTSLRVGELVTVTVELAQQNVGLVIPNAALARNKDQVGVWKLDQQDDPVFTPLILGRTDLSGQVEVLSGLSSGDEIVIYSEQYLSPQSRVYRVDQLAETQL